LDLAAGFFLAAGLRAPVLLPFAERLDFAPPLDLERHDGIRDIGQHHFDAYGPVPACAVAGCAPL
jgi:hypothetical protein